MESARARTTPVATAGGICGVIASISWLITSSFDGSRLIKSLAAAIRFFASAALSSTVATMPEAISVAYLANRSLPHCFASRTSDPRD